MIALNAKTRWNDKKLKRAAEQGTYRSLGHAAASLRLIAQRSIRKSDKPAPEGQPPHTQTRRLPRSILYAVDKRAGSAVIGPSRDRIGLAGGEHEHGRVFGGRKPKHPARPFMGPALRKAAPRMPRFWRASVVG